MPFSPSKLGFIFRICFWFLFLRFKKKIKFIASFLTTEKNKLGILSERTEGLDSNKMTKKDICFFLKILGKRTDNI